MGNEVRKSDTCCLGNVELEVPQGKSDGNVHQTARNWSLGAWVWAGTEN